jgi:hypothetical protein
LQSLLQIWQRPSGSGISPSQPSPATRWSAASRR